MMSPHVRETGSLPPEWGHVTLGRRGGGMHAKKN